MDKHAKSGDRLKCKRGGRCAGVSGRGQMVSGGGDTAGQDELHCGLI